MQSIYIDILKIKDYNFPITLETNKHYKRELQMNKKSGINGEHVAMAHENKLIQSLMSRKNGSSDKKPSKNKKKSKKKGVL